MGKVRAHVVISGMVQGVCFRYETHMRARSLGITGWVMNRRDGKLEAVFEGEKDVVGGMVEWCNKGPNGAIVRDVDVDWKPYTGEFKEFGIEYSR